MEMLTIRHECFRKSILFDYIFESYYSNIFFQSWSTKRGKCINIWIIICIFADNW